MRIGINGSPFTQNLTGVGVYGLRLLREWAAACPGNEFYVYTVAPLLPGLFDDLPNIRVILYAQAKVRGLRLLAYSFILPYCLKRDRIDLFWNFGHGLPLWKPNGVQYGMSIHDIVYLKHPQSMRFLNWLREKLLFSISLKHANRILVSSETSLQDLLQRFNVPQHAVLYPPFDPPRPTEVTPLVAGDYLLAVCTKEPRKNLESLVDAYQALPDTLRQRYKLVFCGSRGWKSDTFYAKIEPLVAKGEVINYDYLPNEARDNLYQHAQLFVFPTFYEGFGMPIIEAMAYGVPVLLSDIPIMREVGADAAAYFPLEAPKAFVEQLAACLAPDWQAQSRSKSQARFAQIQAQRKAQIESVRSWW